MIWSTARCMRTIEQLSDIFIWENRCQSYTVFSDDASIHARRVEREGNYIRSALQSMQRETNRLLLPSESRTMTPPSPPSPCNASTACFPASSIGSSWYCTLRAMVTAMANRMKYLEALLTTATHYRNSRKTLTSPSPVPDIPMAVGLWPLRNLSNNALNHVFVVYFHSSAQNPEPICGVSPILPTSLLVRPPVEVKTAMQPRMSNATAPTVPLGNWSIGGSFSWTPSEGYGSGSSGSPSPLRCSLHRLSV